MSETDTAAPKGTPATEDKAPPTEKFAGKYEGVEAFTKGINELRERAGFAKIDKPLFGQGGMFPDAKHAETYYAGLKQIHDLDPTSRVSPKAPAAAPPPAPPPKEAKADGDLTIKDRPAETPKGIQKVLTKAGLAGKEQELVETWQRDGKLTDEQYAAFAKADRDREEVDAYFGAESAKAELGKTRVANFRAEGEKIAGGKDQLAALREWARTDLKDDPAFKALNGMVDKDPAQYPALVQYIDTQYKIKHGTVNNPARGGTPSTTANAMPSTKAEYDALHKAVAEGNPEATERWKAIVRANGAAAIPGITKYAQR